MDATKPFRLIYALKLDIEPPPGSGPTASSQLIVHLDRAGNSHGRNGRPRPPKTLATAECEAVEHGQEPCPLQYDDQEEWCLSCLARKAVEQYLNA